MLFSPYETYIKTLYEIYKDDVGIGKKIDLNNDGTVSLYEFQKENAESLIRKLDKYGVAMLSDSVGLGKTYTAIEVIKHYYRKNDNTARIEIICPKSLCNQ
ncbi:MAG: hypothetical protein PHO23_02700 [Candidatus Pacebacteria bacterium]|nr:hypothetical protein [Candidatus Paceibacterota bacterium]